MGAGYASRIQTPDVRCTILGNAAETEGRVLIGPLGALCQGSRAREAERKSLIPLRHKESFCVHASVPLTACLFVYRTSGGRSVEGLTQVLCRVQFLDFSFSCSPNGLGLSQTFGPHCGVVDYKIDWSP